MQAFTTEAQRTQRGALAKIWGKTAKSGVDRREINASRPLAAHFLCHLCALCASVVQIQTLLLRSLFITGVEGGALMLRGIVVLGIVALISCACVTSAFCEASKAADPTGMELIAELLKAKGVISPDEAAALKAKTTGAESNESVKTLVDLLKSKGLVSDDEADRLNQALAKTAPSTQAAAKAILVVPRDQEYVQKITQNVVTEVKKDIHEQVQTEVSEKAGQGLLQDKLAPNLPDWLQKLRFSGDARLRYEPVFYPPGNGSILNPGNPTQLLNTTHNTQAEYLRARLKIEADVNDQVTAGVRLATGNQTNPGSDNVIFGDYYVKEGFLLDQAYLRYKPFTDLSVWAGRIPNPWFYTDLIWANDLNFEGVAVNYTKDINSGLTGFVNGGVLPLQAITQITQPQQKWLLGAQAGVEYKSDRQYTAKLGVALYDYENTVGIENPVGQTINDWTAPLYMQKGNTVFNIEPQTGSVAQKFALASQFRDLDILGNFDLACWDPIHVVLSGEYVKNIAFNAKEVSQLSGRPVANMQDNAYRAGLLVGYPNPRKFLQWNLFTYYKYVGTDSVVDAFDDQDFALGGTNAKGWTIGAELGLMKNVWLTARWFTSDQISPFQNSTGPFSTDVFELDTHAAF